MQLFNTRGVVVYAGEHADKSGLIKSALSVGNMQTIDLTQLRIVGEKVESVNFTATKYRDFRHSVLNQSEFYDCDFTETILNGTAMKSCHFTDCTFKGADMLDCDMHGATFTRCEFYGAELDNTHIADAVWVDSSLVRHSNCGGSMSLLRSKTCNQLYRIEVDNYLFNIKYYNGAKTAELDYISGLL